MKAILVSQFGGPDVLKLVKTKIPDVKENKILIKLLAIGINPVETYLRAGTYRILPKLPYIPGRDCAGVVHAVGSRVLRFHPGDLVFCDTMKKGAYAQYYLTSENTILLLGKHLTFAQGAAIGIGYRTAYRALFERARIESGERVLIRGASGGVGLPCIEMAKLHGCFVVATSSSSLGQDQCRLKGADVVMSHNIDIDIIQKLMDDSLFDVIIEMLANKNLDSDLKLLSRGGRVIIVGNKGNIKINPRDLMMKETSIIGMLGGPKNSTEFRRYRGYLNTNILNGRFSPTVNLLIPLEKASNSHIEVIKHTNGTVGKIILCPFGIKTANRKGYFYNRK